MKKLISLVLMLTMTTIANAQSMFDGMSKEELANYEIIVRDKRDGMIKGVMSRSTHKVVRLDSSVEADNKELLKITHSLHEKVVDLSKTVNAYNNGYFTVIGHAGKGKDGLDHSTNGAFHTISENDAIVGGATGCYSKGQGGLCLSGFTNSSFFLGVKYDLLNRK